MRGGTGPKRALRSSATAGSGFSSCRRSDTPCRILPRGGFLEKGELNMMQARCAPSVRSDRDFRLGRIAVIEGVRFAIG
jgi:hypothetical protein